jgi:two-component system, LytTR family, sensor kinase
MIRRKSETRTEIGYHLILWTLLIGPHSFFSSYLIDEHLDLLLYCIVVADGLLMVIVYFVIYFLIEKHFDRGQYLPFVLWLVGLSTAYTMICIKMETDISNVLGRENRITNYALYYFVNISRYTLIGFLLFRLKQNIQQQKKLKQISLEKLRAEVSYLRAQINPHFLFNTLNNLYGLSLQQSAKTPELIMRLSRMMDYMLYEVEGTKVLLKRDLENLLNYIEMERIRQGNNALICYDVQGEVTNELVEPLLFLPLVENAFKHGVNQIIDGAYLEVKLIIRQEHLTCTVKNNYKTPRDQEQFHQSLGLINLRKRLELFYPHRHFLEIYDDSINYHVKLDITDPFGREHNYVQVSEAESTATLTV